MAYCTLDDLRGLIEEQHLITLSNDQAGAVSVDAANIEAAIAQAPAGDRKSVV